jgi:hypothetical protein
MYYGRHLGPAVRLFFAISVPALAFVYGFGRFVGTDVSLALITAIVVSKPLGLLTLAAVARTTFGELFERLGGDSETPRTVTGRLRELTRSIVTGGALFAGLVFVVATLDNAYGTGRLAALGSAPAAVIVLLIVALLGGRAAMFVSDRHRPGSAIKKGLWRGLLLRAAIALPLVLLIAPEGRLIGIVVAMFWLPVAVWIALLRSFDGEWYALAEINPALHTSRSERSVEFADMAGPFLVIAAAMCGLALVASAGIDFSLQTMGLPGPWSGPLSEYLSFDMFEPGLAIAILVRSPLFAATTLAAALFAYQLGRIAWFFIYLDTRVRRDLWDLELLLAQEAKRLEGADGGI